MRPCGSPSFRSVNGIPCASDLANFSSPSLCFTRMEPSRRSIPGLVERGQGRGFEYLHYPVAEPTYHLGRHPAVPNHYPINGARSADFPDIRRQWTVPRRCRLAFVNASEAGVPDQPMASLLSVKGVSPNCPGGAHACGPHCSGRSTCEISWMSRPVRFRAANVSGGFFPYRQRSRSLGGSNWSAKIADESGI